MTELVFLFGVIVGFAIGWFAGGWLWGRLGLGKFEAPKVTVSVDWNSIKDGIVADKRIVVANTVDWDLLKAAAENSGYELISRERH